MQFRRDCRIKGVDRQQSSISSQADFLPTSLLRSRPDSASGQKLRLKVVQLDYSLNGASSEPIANSFVSEILKMTSHADGIYFAYSLSQDGRTGERGHVVGWQTGRTRRSTVAILGLRSSARAEGVAGSDPAALAARADELSS